MADLKLVPEVPPAIQGPPPRLRRHLVAIILLVTLAATTGCGDDSGKGSATATTTGVPLPSGVFAKSEIMAVATLPELVAASSVIVEGRVSSMELGPDLSGGDGLGYVRSTIEVSRSYKGSSVGEQVAYLTLGYDPRNGTVERGDGEHWASVGATGIWFLMEPDLPNVGTDLFVTTSAGQVLLKGTAAVTGGDQQAAAILCGVNWREAQALVARAVIDAKGLNARRVGERSPWSNPRFAGNPCSVRSQEDFSAPTTAEGD